MLGVDIAKEIGYYKLKEALGNTYYFRIAKELTKPWRIIASPKIGQPQTEICENEPFEDIYKIDIINKHPNSADKFAYGLLISPTYFRLITNNGTQELKNMDEVIEYIKNDNRKTEAI